MNQIAPLEDAIVRVREDGSTVVSDDILTRLGNGNILRGRRELRLMLLAEVDQGLPRAAYNGPTEKPPGFRMATRNDEAAMFDLLMLDLEDNAVRTAPIDPDKVRDLIQAATRPEKKLFGIAGVVEGPGGKIVGVCIMLPCEWWWSQQWYYFEMVCYVHPDHRRSHHIDHLLNFERWWVDEMSKKEGHQIRLLCGVLGAHRIRSKIALYRRKFFQAGAAFVYPTPE